MLAPPPSARRSPWPRPRSQLAALPVCTSAPDPVPHRPEMSLCAFPGVPMAAGSHCAHRARTSKRAPGKAAPRVVTETPGAACCSGPIRGCRDVSMTGQAGWTGGMDRRTDGGTDRQADRRDGQADRRDGQAGWTGGQTSRTDRRTDRRDGQAGRTGGQMGGRTGGPLMPLSQQRQRTRPPAPCGGQRRPRALGKADLNRGRAGGGRGRAWGLVVFVGWLPRASLGP